MYAIAFAMLCAMLTSFYVVTAEEQQVAAYQSTAADVAAANFWSYWLVVGQYNHQNPGLAGPVTVADGNLQWQMGYVRNPAWTNTIVGGLVYTYSNPAIPLPAGTAFAIAKRGGNTRAIGIAQGVNLLNVVDGSISFTNLPTGIPNGAIVVVGN